MNERLIVCAYIVGEFFAAFALTIIITLVAASCVIGIASGTMSLLQHIKRGI